MNRYIEFRGKEKDTEKWKYGDLIQDFSFKDNYYIGDNDCNEVGDVFYQTFTVIPETIGQYTGLKDKNGKKIFEGDIVKNEDYTLAVVYNPKVQSFVLTDKNDWLNEPIDRIYDCDDIEEKFINNFFEYNCVSYEVIGNIYENKELLEG